MTYLVLWVLLIPVLYVAYYSDKRNSKKDGDIYRQKVVSFLWAVSGPIGILVYLACWILGVLIIIIKTGQFKSPFELFPLHNPWEES